MNSVFLSPPPLKSEAWLRFKGSRTAQTLLRWAGWRIDWHGLPTAHGVFIAYPHTSNWDFPVGILVKWAIGMPLRFWAKEGLFTGLARFTIGPFMTYCGGVPVNRKAASGMIDDTLAHMRSSDYFWLALAPEGTRSYSPYWRSGFYRLVLAAQCPLGLAYFDFKNKIVSANQFITLTGDETADLATIAAFYEGKAHGCRPEQAGPIAFRPAIPPAN